MKTWHYVLFVVLLFGIPVLLYSFVGYIVLHFISKFW